MGRAMLIIVAGVMVALGFTQIGQQGTVLQMTQQSATYAESTQAYNLTHTGLQLTISKFMQEIYDNPGVCQEGSVDIYEIEGGIVEVEHLLCGDITDEDNSRFRLRGSAVFNEREHTATVTYEAYELHFVPEFDSAIKITTEDFNFDIDGSAAGISGDDPSDEQICGDKPGVTYPPDSETTQFDEHADQIEGDPPYGEDPETSFDEAADLIQRLEGQPGTQTISGNVNENLGSPENPGVFMVDGSTKLAGGASEGWGILIIKATGEMEMEDPDLDLGGNFTFNGLVIYENAFSLSAKGTPSINGTVMIGKTNDAIGNIDVDIRGNVSFQYDCTAQKYAEMASSNINQAGVKFTVLNIFE